MTEHQKDQILKVVSYYMKHELRERIMREAPVAYNAWVEGDVVDVVYKSDGAYRDWETDRKSTRLNSSHRL